MKQSFITDIMDFSLEQDCIKTSRGTFFLFRYHPPNISILSPQELENQIDTLQSLLDSIDIEISFFGCDKVEDLSQNKTFWESCPGEYYAYTADIVSTIESSEVDSSSVQKAYYIIVSTDDRDKVQQLYTSLRGLGFSVELTSRKENASLLRNFLLREFVSFDILMAETDIEQEFDQMSDRKQKKVGGKQPYFTSEIQKRLSPLRFDIYKNRIDQGDFCRQTLLVKNIPSSKKTCQLMELAQHPNSSFMMRLRPMQPYDIKTLVNNQILSQKTRTSSRRQTERIEANLESEQIALFYDNMARENHRVFYTNIFLEVYGSDLSELDSSCKRMITKMKTHGITHESLSFEQKDGYLGVSPLGKECFLSVANNIPSNSLAALYPFSFSGLVDPRGFLLGKTFDGGSFFLDFWSWNDIISNGNFSITGVSGQGKSWLMKKILSMFIMTGANVFMLDPDQGEYGKMFHSLGGTVINCADGRIKINPFEVRRLRMDQDNTDPAFLPDLDGFQNAAIFFQHLSWLRDFFSVLNPSITNIHLDVLMILVKDVYEKHGINQHTNFSTCSPQDYITFSDVYEHLQSVMTHQGQAGQDAYHEIADHHLQDLLLLLRDSYDGSMAFLFNGHTNIQNTRHICFSLVELLSGSEHRTQAVIFNILTYVWNRIALHENKTVFAADELHLIKFPIIIKYLQNFAARVRKYDGVIGTATQNISALNDPEIKHLVSSIYSNTAVKFIFHPGDVDFDATKQLLQLTEGEAEKISIPKKTKCLVKVGKNKYNLAVGALPYEQHLFGNAGGK